TVERTAEDAGTRLAEAVQAGQALGPKVEWPWPRDYDGKRCAYVELDATGVRQQGEHGGPAEGRMAYVGMVCNPGPEWPWPDDEALAEEQARGWRGLLKQEGGAVLAAVLSEWDWPRRPGLGEAVAELTGYLGWK